MKLKQLFCKHKRAKVIGTIIIETNTKERTAISIFTYKCPNCGLVFEKEYNCKLPMDHTTDLKIEIKADDVAKVISRSISTSRIHKDSFTVF